jgi:hypothetical protein
MNALATVAVLTLFSGQSLDGWITLSGQWQVRDNAMVCASAPAAIRTSYESPTYELEFDYRLNGVERCWVVIHSRMTTGGIRLRLTPAGVVPEDAARKSELGGGSNDWIHARLVVEKDRILTYASIAGATDASKAHYAMDLPADANDRGFIRFEALESGLEVRDVTAREEGFKPLIKDDSMAGWEVVLPRDPDRPGWAVEDGVLFCKGHRSSWVRTLRTYDDLVLRLEYRLPPRGNSGIFLRAPIEGRCSRIGLEIQLLDDVAYLGKIKPAQHTGSVYDGIAPELRVPAPAQQWNAIEVMLNGKRVRTTLNGIELYDTYLDNAEKDASSHLRPLATRRVVGFIGLQDHSTTVRFRHVRVRELDGE